MTEAQNHYLKANQRDYAFGFKHLSDTMKEELYLIERIQACSLMLTMIDKGISTRNHSEVMQELIKVKEQYDAKYGTYDIQHYPISGAPIQSQLSMF